MSAADAVTQDRVYRALKGDYLAGTFEPGAKLDLQRLADRLIASKTPVREAVHRLVGEGLFEADAAGGFRVCLYSPIALIQLYEWNAHLLVSLLRLLKPSSILQVLDRVAVAIEKAEHVQLVGCVSRLFDGIAEETGNVEAMAAVSQLNERLLCTRLMEVNRTKRARKELQTMTNSAVADVHKTMRRRIEAYHERRIERQRAILETLMSPRN